VALKQGAAHHRIQREGEGGVECCTPHLHIVSLGVVLFGGRGDARANSTIAHTHAN
jgi:hypothetical protein